MGLVYHVDTALTTGCLSRTQGDQVQLENLNISYTIKSSLYGQFSRLLSSGAQDLRINKKITSLALALVWLLTIINIFMSLPW